jgi:SAM-dependent methyltransferase
MQVTSAVLDFLPKSSEPRTVLVAGSGAESLPEWEAQGYTVIRLDIAPHTKPDILASMTDIGDISPIVAGGEVDVVFCCHALEHLYPHEVQHALSEFKRVLKPGGVVVILVPDLEDVKPTEEILDYPEAGPISGLHLFYGDASQIPQFPFMAHHCGFVKETLKRALDIAGFAVTKAERMTHYNLAGMGVKA